MLSLKPGVRITGVRPEVIFALIAAERVYAEFGVQCVVTAGIDGKHKPGSLHYAGAAADLRSRDFKPGDAEKAVSRLRAALGLDFDVMMEADHIHVEFQPRG